MTQNPDRVPPIQDWNRLLSNKVAVATGGGAGIGGAISRLFARLKDPKPGLRIRPAWRWTGKIKSCGFPTLGVLRPRFIR